MTRSRNIYVTALCIGFISTITRSFLELLEEPTTFQESIEENVVKLPSLTFCERRSPLENFTNFDEVQNKIKTIKHNYNCTLVHRGLGVNKTYLNLENREHLQKHFNVSKEEVWSNFATMQFREPYGLIICTTLNLHFIKSPPNRGQLWVRTKNQIDSDSNLNRYISGST